MSGRDAVENTRFVDALAELRAAGWALCMVKPADEPAVALLRRDGLTLRVERDDVGLGAPRGARVRADATGGHGVGYRPRRHGVPRPPPESPWRTGDRLAHPHPARPVPSPTTSTTT